MYEKNGGYKKEKFRSTILSRLLDPRLPATAANKVTAWPYYAKRKKSPDKEKL